MSLKVQAAEQVRQIMVLGTAAVAVDGVTFLLQLVLLLTILLVAVVQELLVVVVVLLVLEVMVYGAVVVQVTVLP
jgi:hypothetical protein